MNDEQIRRQFHRKRLRRHHDDSETVVVDELGLKHGRCRADIAVINGHFIGYEIKSDNDSLRRLPEQIDVYSAVFDRASVIVGEKHACAVKSLIPGWWGLILASQGPRGGGGIHGGAKGWSESLGGPIFGSPTFVARRGGEDA